MFPPEMVVALSRAVKKKAPHHYRRRNRLEKRLAIACTDVCAFQPVGARALKHGLPCNECRHREAAGRGAVAPRYQRRPRYKYEPAVVNYTPLTPYVQAVPIEEGFIDYRAFLTALHASGFRGSVAYEMCSPLEGGGRMENLDRCARLFLEFLGRVRQETH